MWYKLILTLCLLNCIQSENLYEFALYEVAKCNCVNRPSNLNVSDIKVYVYNFQTKSNSSYTIDNAADSILSDDDFNPNQCIHLFVPGFLSNIYSSPAETTRCILSQVTCNGMKPLVIIFDHSEYTGGNTILDDVDLVNAYEKAVNYTKSISLGIAKFLIELLDEVDRDNVNIVGHSLGGQMVGLVGDFVKNITGNPLRSIYAADPAGPCFEDCPSEHIKSGDAEVVIAIHCNAGQLGTNLNLTDYDFYSGNGVQQDTCNGEESPGIILPVIASICSHLRCVAITENPAIHRNIWKAVKCPSYNDYFSGECNNNETTYAGYTIIPNTTHGVYYFTPTINLTCEIDESNEVVMGENEAALNIFKL